jgi:ribosomal protein S18 acetylase RimI-like enzyme
MEFRIGTKEDAKGVGELLRKSYNIKDQSEGAEVYLSEIKKGYVFVIIVDDSGVKGIASWSVHDLPKHQLAELNRIAVDPSLRGKGYAKKLFDFLLQNIQEFYIKNKTSLRKLYVLTHNSNLRAQSFYTKLGFFREAVLKNHYYDGEDEIVMSMYFSDKNE